MPVTTGRTASTRQGATRVMLVLHGLGMGGAEMVVLNLARELIRSGVPVQVVALSGDTTPLAENMRKSGIIVLALNKRRGPDLRVVPRLVRAMARFRPTTLHTHLPVLEYVLPAARLYRHPVRIIHTVHSMASQETQRPLLRRVNRYAFHHGVVPVALNSQVQSSVCAEYGLRPEQVPVVLNGVDTQHFSSSRKPAEIPNRPLRLLCVARMEQVKNHALLLEVVAVLKDTGEAVELVLVGDGVLRPELEARARRLGVDSLVHFVGIQEDTAGFYQQADLFVLLSQYEGLPMSIVEAMAAGLPVVATAVGGVPDILTDGVNGRLVPAEASPVAAVVASLHRDPQTYERLSRGAVATAARYSAQGMMEAYRDLYR